MRTHPPRERERVRARSGNGIAEPSQKDSEAAETFAACRDGARIIARGENLKRPLKGRSLLFKVVGGGARKGFQSDGDGRFYLAVRPVAYEVEVLEAEGEQTF